MSLNDARERSPSPGTQSIERALSLLNAFTEQTPERRISELVAFSDLGQSTVSRLVGALELLGLLEQNSHTGLYRIGRRSIELAALALNQTPVHLAARTVAQALACETGLGVNVAERNGARLFYILHFEGALAPRRFSLLGPGGPLYATGMGKALLSDLSDEDIAELVGTDFHQFTPHTITTLPALLKELGEVRGQGYATELEELALSRACIAAPIRDRTGRVVASISISGPLSAINLDERRDELSKIVIERADQISVSLGYTQGRQ